MFSGKDETESILAAIDVSSVVFLCLSSAANASKLVTQQAARAFNKKIPIVPLRIEDIEPSNALKLFLGSQEPVDAFTPPLESHLVSLATVIGPFLAETAAPAAGLIPPPAPSYKAGTPAARTRRIGTPLRRVEGKVLLVAVLAALAIIVIAALFLFPQAQPIAVSSETPTESPSTEKPSISPTPTPTISPTPTPTFFPTPTPTFFPTPTPIFFPTPTPTPTPTFVPTPMPSPSPTARPR